MKSEEHEISSWQQLELHRVGWPLLHREELDVHQLHHAIQNHGDQLYFTRADQFRATLLLSRKRKIQSDRHVLTIVLILLVLTVFA
jgi:hypothetical protein